MSRLRLRIGSLLLAASLPAVAGLTFTSTQYVNVGKPAVINDIANGGTFTITAWVYRTSDGANQIIWAPGGLVGPWLMDDVNGATQGCLRLLVFRATTNSDTFGNALVIPLNTWTFVAGTWDSGASPPGHLYAATAGAIAAEIAYGTQTAGSGTPKVDNAVNKYIANGNTLSAGFIGTIARVSVHNTVLTLGQIRERQYGMFSDANTIGWWELGYNGTGTQPDFTGRGTSGTVTGASVGPGAPVRMPR